MAVVPSSLNPDENSPEHTLQGERLRLVRSLIDGLSPETRAILAQELIAGIGTSTAAASPTGVIAAILSLIPPGATVTAGELRQAVAERGIGAEPKEVYNAIGYLARTGKLRRLGYGRYLVDGVVIGTSDDLGGEKARDEDLADGD